MRRSRGPPRGGPWPALCGSPIGGTRHGSAPGVLVFAALLCVTSRSSLHAVPLLLGALARRGRCSLVARPARCGHGPRGCRSGAVDVVMIVVLALAIPNVIVYTTHRGAAEHLLPARCDPEPAGLPAGVGKPAARRRRAAGQRPRLAVRRGPHLLPRRVVSPRPDRLRDGSACSTRILTALFFILALRRPAGRPHRPLLAAAALAVAVLVLVYGRQYNVGALPETGPLRFGLPLLIVATTVVRGPLAAAAGVRGRRPSSRSASARCGRSRRSPTRSWCSPSPLAIRAWLRRSRRAWRMGSQAGGVRDRRMRGGTRRARADHAGDHRPAARLGAVPDLHPLVPARRNRPARSPTGSRAGRPVSPSTPARFASAAALVLLVRPSRRRWRVASR